MIIMICHGSIKLSLSLVPNSFKEGGFRLSGTLLVLNVCWTINRGLDW